MRNTLLEKGSQELNFDFDSGKLPDMFYALVVKLADTSGLGPDAERHGGSSPSKRT